MEEGEGSRSGKEVETLEESTGKEVEAVKELPWRSTAQCVHWTVFFSFRPSALGLIVQPQACHVIEHIFVPTHSVERNIEKSRFP